MQLGELQWLIAAAAAGGGGEIAALSDSASPNYDVSRSSLRLSSHRYITCRCFSTSFTELPLFPLAL